MKIGIQIVHEDMAYREIEAVALLSENLGFDCVWIGDHFWWTSPDKPMLECWTLLTALASRTTKIRIGSLVLNNLFRKPALVANMANSLSEITKGRLNLGLGAGWHKKECQMYNFNFPSSKERINNLYFDVHYIASLLRSEIALWIGGFGDYILKKVVARYADASNFERFDLSPKKCKERIEYLDYYRKRWNGELLEKSICLNVAFEEMKEHHGSIRNLLTKDYLKLGIRNPSLAMEFVKKRLGFRSPTTIIGNKDTILNRLKAYADVGITYFVIRYIDDATLEQLANQVYPEVSTW